jgi:hypothetical protein
MAHAVRRGILSTVLSLGHQVWHTAVFLVYMHDDRNRIRIFVCARNERSAA